MKHEQVVTASSLDLDPTVTMQDSIEACQTIEYPCFTALPKDDETPLEFRIDKSDAFIDLNRTYLEIEVQILNADGTKIKTEIDAEGNITKQALVAPVNNVGCALFQNVDLFIADQKVTLSDTTYPWWTYIYQLLYCDPLTKKTILKGNYWYEDDGRLFDTVNMSPDEEVNRGFKNRYAVFNDSNKVRVFVPLLLNRHIDKLLPPQTEVMLRFLRAPAALTLMGKADTSYKIKIWDAKLFVGRVKLTDAASRFYERLLETKGFTYPIQSCMTKVKTVSKGDQNVEWVPFVGALPKRIYFWQITHEAYNAKIDKNLYNFQSFGLNRLQVFKNGISLPLNLGFNSIQDGGHSQLYQFSAKGINSPQTFDIVRDDYAYGYLITVVDLTAAGTTDYDSPKETGSVRLALDYKAPLEGSATLFCLGEFDETLTIDGNRQITLN